jgi:hypothetical protein
MRNGAMGSVSDNRIADFEQRIDNRQAWIGMIGKGYRGAKHMQVLIAPEQCGRSAWLKLELLETAAKNITPLHSPPHLLKTGY